MKLSTKLTNQKGFTLVELAIVLVIIGLIVGGVLAGQDLIKSAKLQKGVKQINDADVAATTYLSKYNQLPGDDSNAAVTYAAAPTPAIVTGVTSTAVALGNNDGLIQATSTAAGAATATAGNSGEAAAFYAELYDNGYIATKMNSVALTTIAATTGATNVGMFDTFAVESPSSLLVPMGIAGTGNYLIVVGQASAAGVAGVPTWARGLQPINASALDAKLDDASPSTGKVTMLAVAPAPGTLDATNAATCAGSATSYNTNLKIQLCTVGIRMSF